jgi:DNA-directed RNA polymerase specialized sigma24 family protein
LLADQQDDAAALTLERLLDQQNQYGYITIVRHLARRRVPEGQQWHDEEDLFQTALMEILKVLPTARGALAETAWVRFCQNCFSDAWRAMHGRRGERLQVEFAQPTQDNETGDYLFQVETTTGEDAPWHAGIDQSELPRVEALVLKTINAIGDPFIRAVAADQFSAVPSPISSARESNAHKPPLTEQLNASRFQISRALRSAKARLAAELLADQHLQLDREWLRAFVR